MRGRYWVICSAVFAVFLGCAPAPVPVGGSGGVPGGSGGAPGSGGVTTTGGATGTGGATATGGATGIGGVTGTGGGTGGRGVGGMPGTGGAVGTGGGSGAGGSSPLTSTYFIGADVSYVEGAPTTLFTDTDGTRKEFFQLMKGHGFNYIRVRTFVDPEATDGNDTRKTNGGLYDITHTVAFGKRIKDAGMGFLLDFHYSDNWADPAKQCVPIAWQSATTIAALATLVHDYTKDAITQLVTGGARPDMVQIGNEITPGMLLHRCGAGGVMTGPNPVTGTNSTAGWPNLGMLLKAAAQGIKEVDPGIKIMLHIDRGGDKPTDTAGQALATSINYINSALAQGVPFDVLGESCYQLWQGDPASATNTVAGWTNTFTQLAMRFPNLKFVAAEYGPLERELNDILFNLPRGQGIGTFYWEATHSNTDNAGHELFTGNNTLGTVATPDLMLYDLMKTAYAPRL